MKKYLHTDICDMSQVVNTLLRQDVYEKVFAYSAESMQNNLHTVGRSGSVMLCM